MSAAAGRQGTMVGSGLPVRVTGRCGPCRRAGGVQKSVAVRPLHAITLPAQVEDPGRNRRVLANLAPGSR